MAVDNPVPLCTVADLQVGAFADLVRTFSQAALTAICVEASRACETEVGRRFMAFTVTESHYARGVNPDELGGAVGGMPMDLTSALGASSALSAGPNNLVRRVWVRETAPLFPDMWGYSAVTVAITTTMGPSITAAPMLGPLPDSGLIWFQPGTFCPIGSIVQVTYSGGYQTVPGDLRRAAKYMAAAICCHEIDPGASTGHDPSNLEALATGWLSPYMRG